MSESLRNPALSVLTIGFSRSLWQGPQAEDYVRMTDYSRRLKKYVAIINSRKHHNLQPLEVAHNFHAIPTGAGTVAGNLLRILRIGTKQLKSNSFDLIQAQDPIYTGFAARHLSRRFKIPLCVCVYGPNVYDPHWVASSPWHHLAAPIGRIIVNGAQALQVDGRRTARIFQASGIDPSRIHLKPMVPANLEDFLAINRGIEPERTLVRFLFVGRLVQQKDLLTMLAAFRELLHTTRVPATLDIVGSGHLEAKLRSKAATLGLNGSVQFCGVKSRAEVVKHFADSDVFLLSSRYEGFPRVLMESAAAGLPVVSTDVSGSDESIVDRVTGRITQIGNVHEFADAMRTLAENPQLRRNYGAAARNLIGVRMDPQNNTDAQLRIWETVTSRGYQS